MDNALTSCLGYFIYLYRTDVIRSDSPFLYIHLEEEEKITKINHLSTLTTLFFIILLVQSVINLENIGQKTLEKTEGAAKSGQIRNTSHIGLKS